MHEIEMLGLLDHDVLSSIEIPYLQEPYRLDISTDDWNPESTDSDMSRPDPLAKESTLISREEADQFDMDVFAAPSDMENTSTARTSVSSSGSAATLNAPFQGSHSDNPRSAPQNRHAYRQSRRAALARAKRRYQ